MRRAKMTVKTAIIGASGYIGRHLWAAYNKEFAGSLGTSFSSANPSLNFFDIRQPDIKPLRLEEQGYESVIITAAKPNIAYCQDHRDEAYAVNVTGTLESIRQLGRTRLQTIFLSSDYVFKGTTGNYQDNAPTEPTTEYGRQKVLVEQAIPSLTDNFLILRIGKIYGVEKGDRTILDELAEVISFFAQHISLI
jgi:dTDP-4-dehydrorhamnose reductase